MIGKLNHVGVATPSLDEAVKLYRDVLGATDITPKRTMEEQGVTFQFVNLGNAQIELIEPFGENSPILNFLAKNPQGGQHHICFEVEDIIAARDEMREKGARILGTGEPRIGAHGTPIIFLHPKDMGGQLVELMGNPEGAALMGPVTAISIYLVIWWTVFMGVLPFGNVSFHEAGIAPPPGCDPGAPMQANMKKKLVITSLISAGVFAIFYLVVVFHLITLPGVAQVY